MDSQLQRDLGRVEAKVEIMSDDVKKIKDDLSTIKNQLISTGAVKESDWKRMSVVAVLASIATSVFNWVRPFFT